MQTYDHAIHADEILELEKNRQFLLAQLFGAQLDLAEPFLLPSYRGITAWEAVTCVGLHPPTRQLEAVVEVRRGSGYSGDLCSSGSTEYVRFFVDWHDGLGFQDVGLASFQVFDIPSQHPIQHLVRLELDEQNRALCCNQELLPRVRAVLGWNEIPSLDAEGDLPVYGNRVDATVQIAAKHCLSAIDGEALLAYDQLATLKPELQPIAATWSSLIKEYRALDVEEERLTYPALSPMLDGVSLATGTVGGALQADLAQLQELDLNLNGIFETLAFGEKGNRRYEELVCVGFDSDLDTLGAVIHIKRPAGYSGNLCHAGSTEYVRFWADWDGTGWDDLGTARVPVHDLSKLPAEGAFFALSLPVDSAEFLRSCNKPQVIRVRAVLSWERVPSHPERLETWGNRLDAWVRLRPQVESSDPLVAELYRVGGVGLSNISPVSFLAYPSLGAIHASACGAAAKDRPFAGNVAVAGRIRDRSGNRDPIYYQVQYRPHVTAGPQAPWLPVTHQVSWRLDYPPPQVDVTLTSHQADGWFEYQEKLNLGPSSVYVVGEHLAVWGTRGLPDGAYDLRLAYAKGHPVTGGSTVYATSPVTLRVDNTSFRVSGRIGSDLLDMTSDLDLVIEGASSECRRYRVGDVVKGRLRAVDANFHFWSLDLQPVGRAHGATASPRCRGYRAVGDSGDSNTAWSLDTSTLESCGYTLRLRAYDRAIVDSNGAYRHWGEKYVGIVVD